jgi:hypothetical protein
LKAGRKVRQIADDVIFVGFMQVILDICGSQTIVIPVLVTGIQRAQVLELKESFDPTDVGSLDPRHKGEDDGNVVTRSSNNQISGFSAVWRAERSAFIVSAIPRG